MATRKSGKATGSAKVTIDHDEIQQWVEAHGGHPAMVKRTARNGRGGILRIDFPGYSGEDSLTEVSWPDFFEKFEESQLAFLYQDQSASGRQSRFNKLVARDSVQPQASARRSSKARAGSRASGARGASGARAKKAPSRSAGGATSKKRAPQRAASKGRAATSSRATKSARGAGASGSRAAAGRSKAASKKKASGRRAARDEA